MVSLSIFSQIATHNLIVVGCAIINQNERIMNDKESKKAIRNVNSDLANVESEYRLCPICGKIITEGYYYSDTEYCCSDKCGAEFENVSEEAFKQERENAEDVENWDEGYWTTIA